jgi:hypothetical protein
MVLGCFEIQRKCKWNTQEPILISEQQETNFYLETKEKKDY